MKKLIEDVNEDGLELLLGERVTFFCMNYFYVGKLIGVNDKYVLLEEPSIIYETGSFNENLWKDAQPLPNNIYVMLSCVEAFGLVK